MTPPSQTPPADLAAPIALHIRLFGPFTVRVMDAPLPPLRTRKDAWLLALLILKHNRPLDRTWLAGTLWPDSDHSGSLKNLRNSLHDLRRALGSQANRLSSPTPSTLCLDLEGADVDILVFDAGLTSGEVAGLERAVGLYRGPLLEGCEEEWVVLEREQREQACLEALESLARFELETGAVAQASLHLRTCIGIDAFRETAQCALMTALASSGDYAGVTQVYREFRLLLHEELHAQPAAETTALYQKIRVRARQVAAGGAAPLRPASLARRLSDASADSPPKESEDFPEGNGVLHNLPPSLTSFIGREKECYDIKELLTQTRLLTLTGAGGSGKTRLSLEVAGESIAAYPDGVWLVELASLSDQALVVKSVATVLDVREQPGVPLVQTLVAALRTRAMLLILDNCEHLLVACGELAAALLRACPGVRLLATSRERLGIAGEQTYRVPSLSLPALDDPMSVESIHRYESVRLFVARARLTRSDFRVSPQDVEAVAQVCHRLDGIPLAIELAAARVRSLSVEDLQRRLDDCFHLLTGGNRSALPRQQTLRGLIDWSYDLLSDPEKWLLKRLSVFAGGWTLEAAEQVCGSIEMWECGSNDDVHTSILPHLQTTVLDLLTSLVDKSLVIAEERYGTVRYRLLETVRQYAHERLLESGEIDAVRRRHRDYFLALAEDAMPKLRGAEQVRWLAVLEEEHDNLRRALTLCVDDRNGGEAGLRLGKALSVFWQVRGHLSEGRRVMAAVLGHPGGQEHTKGRAAALDGAGLLAWTQGDYGAAGTLFEHSLAIFRELDDKRGMSVCFGNMGSMARSQGDFSRARSLLEQSLAIDRELGERRSIAVSLHALGNLAANQSDFASARPLFLESLAMFRELGDKRSVAYCLHNLGNLTYSQGDCASARTLQDESLVIQRELGDKQGISICLCSLGTIASDLGDYAFARSLLKESLTIVRDLGDKRGISILLAAFAAVAAAEKKLERAVRLWGAAEALRDEIGTPLPPDEQETYDREVAAARQALGEATFAGAWNAGRGMAMEQAIEHALADSFDVSTGACNIKI